ncbi:MAG: NYN domain-containing protein [Patescibacteria group bacterium]
MGSKEKVLVIIDGGNTYSAFHRVVVESDGNKKLPLLPKGAKFDYKKFAEYLANEREIVAIKYYIGIVRDTDHTEKSALMVSNQQKFLQKLENMGLIIERGRIVYDHSTREKGVDVKMAIDMVIGASENIYHSVILISSDTDLMPAINFVQLKNKKVEYVGFSNRTSTALLKHSDIQRVFSETDLTQFTF